jgi:hypothetical protein
VTRVRRIGLAVTLSFCASGASGGQAPAIPVVTLPDAAARSTDHFGAIINVRELPGGKLLVDDGKNRQVKMLTATLATERVVLDSSLEAANTYGNFPLPLTAYLGDSTLYPSVNKARGVFVIDPSGNVARTLAMPRVSDVALMRRVGVDDKGRVLFMAMNPVTRPPATGVPPTLADSAPLLRADFLARTTDTIAWVARPYARVEVWTPRSSELSYWVADPLRSIDEWAVLTDGSLALVRGHDYHIDWLRSDGTKSATPKLPFDWKQMSDADKLALIDTVQAQWIAAAGNNSLLSRAEHSPTPWSRQAMSGSSDVNAPRHPSFDTTKAVRTEALLNGALLARMPDRPSPDQVYDYYAPMRAGAALADMANRLWLLPTISKQSKAGELVYDVVSSKGELLERVRVPLGRYIVGFGRDGVVYMATGGLSSGFTIERSKLPTGK